MICINSLCQQPTNPDNKVYFGYPAWLKLPKMIVDHCECGKHNRIWDQNQAKKFFKANGVDLRKLVRVGEVHRA